MFTQLTTGNGVNDVAIAIQYFVFNIHGLSLQRLTDALRLVNASLVIVELLYQFVIENRTPSRTITKFA